MKFRLWITLSFLGLVLSSIFLSLWSVWSWVDSWSAIFTGAQLISPLGCECGVSITFWQHPYLYGGGLGSTALLVAFSSWVSFSLFKSWWMTRKTINTFVQAVPSAELENLFVHLRKQVLSTYWPTLLTPQLVVIQDSLPKAMSSGFLQPKVFISTATVEQVPVEELQAILTHEFMHLRSLDPVLTWCASALASVLPAAQRHNIQSRLHEYIECKTDGEAAELVGQPLLGRALLRVAAWQPQPAMLAAVHMPGLVEKRLNVLAGWSQRPEVPWRSILGLGLWLCALILGSTLALRQVDQVYAQEIHSPACVEAESIVYMDNTLVLICPVLRTVYTTMSVE